MAWSSVAQYRSVFLGADVSVRHFSTSADMSYGHFDISAEMSWVRSVLTPSVLPYLHYHRGADLCYRGGVAEEYSIGYIMCKSNYSLLIKYM